MAPMMEPVVLGGPKLSEVQYVARDPEFDWHQHGGASDAWVHSAPRAAPRAPLLTSSTQSPFQQPQPFGKTRRGQPSEASKPLRTSPQHAAVPRVHRSVNASVSKTPALESALPDVAHSTGRISFEDWAQRSDAHPISCSGSSKPTWPQSRGDHLNAARGSSNVLAPPPECDSSLRELLAPLVAECVHDQGRISPPNAMQVASAFAAISALGEVGVSRGGSHFVSAVRNLAKHGFRRCALVVDKLGMSIRCHEETDLGYRAEQIDFPWSSISDIQDPMPKAGLQGCAVTVGIREPSRVFEGPCGGLALVLRLQDKETARRLADAALAFKAYEAQTALWNACSCATVQGTAALAGVARLLLDEHGFAFWSAVDEHGSSRPQAAKAFQEPFVHTEQGPAQETPCCNLCWC